MPHIQAQSIPFYAIYGICAASPIEINTYAHTALYQYIIVIVKPRQEPYVNHYYYNLKHPIQLRVPAP